MSASELIINTTLGRVRGRQCESVYGDVFYSFEKIPYAECPIDNLRFRPPQAKKPWPEVLECTQPAHKPVQKNFVNNQIEGDEDCLYVNIFTKQLESNKPLPVIVFFYGGGFERGDPSTALHGPDYLMMNDMIFATVGYRLGPFGFLKFTDPELLTPGNAGLKDQLMALRWLKENIAHFNGDPENITAAGESAGAASVHYLMCCPLAKGLFHKAILVSGNILCPWAYSPLEDLPYRLAKSCGYMGPANEYQILKYLRKQPAENLLKHYLPTKEENLNDCLFTFGPSVEAYKDENCIISKHPEELLHESWANHIPVLMSGTSFEGLLMFGRVLMAPFLLTELESNPQHFLPLPLKKKMPSSLGQIAGTIVKTLHFKEKKAVMENVMEYCDYVSYKVFWHPILRTLRTRIKPINPSAAPTYIYRFDFDSPDFNHQRIKYCGKQMRGVAHVDDHSYVFYGSFSWKLSPETDEYKTIKRMIAIWYNFALRSDPNGEEIARELSEPWLPAKQIDDGNIKCLNIAKELAVIDLPEMKKLRVWDNLYEMENVH